MTTSTAADSRRGAQQRPGAPAKPAVWEVLDAPGAASGSAASLQAAAQRCPLRLFEPPRALPPLKIFMQWYRTREQDGATIRLRDRIVAVSRRLGLMAH